MILSLGVRAEVIQGDLREPSQIEKPFSVNRFPRLPITCIGQFCIGHEL